MFVNIRDDEGEHVKTMRACQVRVTMPAGKAAVMGAPPSMYMVESRMPIRRTATSTRTCCSTRAATETPADGA